MKLQILKLSMICLALIFCFISCDKSTDLQEEGASQLSETPTMDDSDFDPSTVVEYPSKLIATIQKDGHQITFSTTGPPESQGILMAESLYGMALENGEFITGLSEETTPFDIFLAMTDKEVDVPMSIATSAKDNQLELSGRDVQETNRMLNLLDENYTEPEAAMTEVRSCYDLPWLSCYPDLSWNLSSCDFMGTGKQSTKFSYAAGWKKVRKISARVSHNCGRIGLFFFYWDRTSGGNWALASGVLTSSNSGGNITFTHWIPNLTERKVNFIPTDGGPGSTVYKTTTQFVQ